MIKGKDGYPVKELEIEVELRDRMVSHIQSSIVRNLEAIKKFLLQIPGYEDICAGIYTYAVEEYGKALYLKGLSSPSSSPDISSSSNNNNTINLQYKGAFLYHPQNSDKRWMCCLIPVRDFMREEAPPAPASLLVHSLQILLQTLRPEREYFLQTLLRTKNLSRCHQK